MGRGQRQRAAARATSWPSDRAPVLRETATGRLRECFFSGAFHGSSLCLYSADSKYLIYLDRPGTPDLREAATGGIIAELWEGYRDDICWVMFAPDGKLLGTVGQDATLLLWDWKKLAELTRDGRCQQHRLCWEGDG